MITTNRTVISLLLSIFILGFSGSKFMISESDSKVFENFSISDYNKKVHTLKEFSNKKAIVVMFISTQCPVSNAYNNRMAKLYQDFGADFSIIGINSNRQEDIDNIKHHAEDNNLSFVILKDDNNVVADKFGASSTPEIYVLNNSFRQLYHGRIDDSRNVENVETSDLRNVLNEIKEGKEISVKETKAFGCSIKKVRK